jgi:predicted nucleic acid-binding Zn ribbon protein
MKKGEIYVCEDCGIELQVVKTCADDGSCTDHDEECGFTCCGKPLTKKQ